MPFGSCCDFSQKVYNILNCISLSPKCLFIDWYSTYQESEDAQELFNHPVFSKFKTDLNQNFNEFIFKLSVNEQWHRKCSVKFLKFKHYAQETSIHYMQIKISYLPILTYWWHSLITSTFELKRTEISLLAIWILSTHIFLEN
jgi:hypothetical protein